MPSTERSGITGNADTVHEEAHTAEIKRDEQHAQAMYNHLTTNKTNPFDVGRHPELLINTSMGVHGTQRVEESMLGVIIMGQKMMQE